MYINSYSACKNGSDFQKSDYKIHTGHTHRLLSGCTRLSWLKRDLRALLHQPLFLGRDSPKRQSTSRLPHLYFSFLPLPVWEARGEKTKHPAVRD